jgi:hypothetical protein
MGNNNKMQMIQKQRKNQKRLKFLSEDKTTAKFQNFSKITEISSTILCHI